MAAIFGRRLPVFMGMAMLVVATVFLQEVFAADPTSTTSPIAEPFPHAPPWVADQTMYEVNLRQFSSDGSIDGFNKQLPRLKQLGVGILWFMPVNPIGVAKRTGKLGSPYAIVDYKQFNAELGTLDQFRATIDQAHRLGMHVILDWVGGHTAFDHPWILQHPDWYKHDAAGQFVHPMPTWVDVAALDFDSAAMRSEMIESMAYWVRDVGVDGFRCDSAEFVPLNFWCEARNALRAIKPVFMLAEGNDPALMNYAFDSAYAWYLPSNMEGIVKGTKSVADLANFFKAEATLVPAGRFRLNFTSNHDKNAWEGTTSELLGDGVDAFTILTFTVPGMPLIYSGQETGAEHRLNFFDRDPIAWRDDPKADLYRKLIRLKNDNRSLWNGAESAPLQIISADPKQSAFCYQREGLGDRIVVLLNLSAQPVTVSTPPNVEQMHVVLGDSMPSDANHMLTLQPWAYRVWSNIP